MAFTTNNAPRFVGAGGRIVAGFASRRSTNYRSARRNSSSSSSSSSSTSSSSSSTSPPPSSPSSLNNNNPLRWYASKLDTHPMTTKCISSGLIAGSGDLLCQYLHSRNASSSSSSSSSSRDREIRRLDHDDDDDDDDDERMEEVPSSSSSADSNNNTTTTTTNGGVYDWTRTARFVALGTFLVAPTVHAWYGCLMSTIPGSGISSVLRRLAWDQGFFAPLFLPVFVSCLTVLEHVVPDYDYDDYDDHDETSETTTRRRRRDRRDEDLISRLISRLQNDVPDALVVGWSIWIPSMAFMFAFVPGKFQVLFSNGVGFVWNSYLSWRTHEGEKESD